MTHETKPYGVQVEGSVVRAYVDLRGASPLLGLRSFIDPSMVEQWWRGVLLAELIPGGTYEVDFPGIDRKLVGRVLDYRPSGSLRFSWAWSHDPSNEWSAAVSVSVGAHLEIEHGPVDGKVLDPTSVEEHREGWEYFVPRLADSIMAQSGAVRTDSVSEPRTLRVDLSQTFIDAVNIGVRTGSWQPLGDLLDRDAVMAFIGIEVGPWHTRDAIVAAYQEHPPDEELAALGPSWQSDGWTCVKYAWGTVRTTQAGELHLFAPAGRVLAARVLYDCFSERGPSGPQLVQ